MFGIDSSELLFIAIVALVVIGPKDLPKAMRFVGYWVGKARAVSRQFRSGFDAMVREAELEEMEKKWAAENARILAEHPAEPAIGDDASREPDHPATEPVMVEQPHVDPAPAADAAPAADTKAPS